MEKESLGNVIKKRMKPGVMVSMKVKTVKKKNIIMDVSENSTKKTTGINHGFDSKRFVGDPEEMRM